jgi:hypothetical protein
MYFVQQALRRKQVDLCELLGSGKPPENGTVSRQDPVRQMRADGPYDQRAECRCNLH